MLKYGSDKPDLRNPLFIIDISDLFVDSDFKPFANKTVRAIRVPKMASDERASKTFFKNMEEFAISIGMKGLGYVKVREADSGFDGPIDKFLTDDGRAAIRERAALESNDVLYFVAESSEMTAAKYALLDYRFPVLRKR
jgi:aspartyl-tRNA synthetase